MDVIFKNWWMIFLRGVLLLVFGVFAVTNPAHAIILLVYYLGIISLASGVFILISYIFDKKVERKNWTLFTSFVDILFGFIVVLFPFSTAMATSTLFTIFIGFWALIGGITLTGNSFKYRKNKSAKWILLLLGGLLSIFLAIIILSNPLGELIGLTVIIGIFSVIFGFTNMIWALEIKRIRKELNENTEDPDDSLTD